jgi:hypothetical protein
LEADITNCRGVDQRHELLDVVDEETVEQVGVGGLETRKVEVLVDTCASTVDHSHGTHDLGIRSLHDVGDQAGEVLLDSFFWSEGGA